MFVFLADFFKRTNHKLIIGIALIAAALASPAHAQKTKAQIIAEIPVLCPSGQLAGACTVQNVQQLFSDIANSIMPTAPVGSGNVACFNGTTGLLQDCGAAGPVTSFNGRVGGVVPASNDYTTALVNNTQTGTGAVARTAQAKLGEVLSVKDFGAVCDGVTNDATAIQNAINAAQQAASPSKSVYFPPGTCVISTALSVTGAVRLFGDSFATSIIQPAVGIDAIDITTTLAVMIEKLGISYATNASGGTAAITVNPAGATINSSSVFRDLQILNAEFGISFVKAQTFVVDNVKILLFGSTAIAVQNTTNADAGDSTVVNSYLLGRTTAAPACLLWTSSGGLRFVNNKCLTTTDGVLLQLAVGAVTAQMVVTDNSFDGMAGSGLRVIRSGTTETFSRVTFNNNICNATLICVNVPSAAGIWLTGLTIIGNNVIGPNNASAIGFTVAATQSFIISHNNMTSQNAATVLVSTNGNANLGVVGPNIKVGTFAANSILSANTTTIAPN